MVILVLNSGSSSIKYKLFDIEQKKEKLLAKGMVERIGEDVPNHGEALKIILKRLEGTVEACGHRVVHGGDRFKESVLIDDEVLEAIEEFSELAPLHNPPSLLTIVESRGMLSDVPHVAVFDTAFYQVMPEYAYTYAIPYALCEKYRIRKYGFHGTSHRYVAWKASQILKKDLGKLNLITCHLGNGCSITAIKNGKAIDTSMGFTPLEGVVMGTRSGDIDPAVVAYLVQKEGVSVDRVMELLNKESGLLGVSGVSNDMREIVKASRQNKRARLAIDIFIYRIKKYIGSYKAILINIDAVVFTGGIGENQKALVDEVCRGVVKKPTRVLVVPTDEELMIAKDIYKLVSN